MPPQPFEIRTAQAVIDDLRDRLGRVRWTDDVEDDNWEYGTDQRYLRELVDYWRTDFDWPQQEAALNRFSHVRADIDGLCVHFIHERGRGDHPLPLVLTHGYPDSFVRFLKVIPLLTDPAAHGGEARDAFDVIVPSLPGFGFSDKPPSTGFTFRIGTLWHRLMTEVLGYQRYAAHGGDWGSTVTEQLARSHAASLIGIHLTDVPFWHLFQKPDDPSREEQKFFDANDAWIPTEGAYALIQGTRPYSLARGLNDAPAGLAAWIVEKFQRWSDCQGQIERRFSKDELLTNITLYWITQTIGSSFQPYCDFTKAGVMRWVTEGIKGWTGGTATVPAAFAQFPKDISSPPRSWAERFFNVQRWTEMPRGGHFAALEEPELLVEDLRTFFRPYRDQS